MDIRKALVVLMLIIAPDRSGSAWRCASYPDPKNGYITCDSLFHLFCSPECHPGYRFATKPAVVYMCGPVTGEWFTYPVGSALPWPDCVSEDRADNSIQEELAKKRAEISKYIADSNTGIPSPYYSQARRIDPEERYHHLFDYIKRAQKAYEYRQAIDIETEQLKNENLEQKNIRFNSQIGSLRGDDGSSPEPWNNGTMTSRLSYGMNAGKRKAVHAHQTGLSKGSWQQTIVRQDNPISNIHKNVPKTFEKGNGFTATGSNVTEKMSARYLQPNLQFQINGSPQKNAISSKDRIEGKEERTIGYKKDSNFVLKMLNNEEFKDLHYLDEHVRLNRDAPTSSTNNKSQPANSKMLDNDKSIVKDSIDNHQHLEFKSSKAGTLRSRDISFAKANTVIKEQEDFSSHVVPIVMSGQSLLQSFSSLLKNDNPLQNLNPPEKRKSLNLLVTKQEQKHHNREEHSKNSTSVVPQEFSLREDDVSLRNKTKFAKQNENPQSVLGISRMNIKDLYESWLKRNGTSMTLNIDGQKKDISSPRKVFPQKEVGMSTSNNASSITKTIQEGKKPLQGEEAKEHYPAQPPREHLFYFPIKKEKLIEILNQTNGKPT